MKTQERQLIGRASEFFPFDQSVMRTSTQTILLDTYNRSKDAYELIYQAFPSLNTIDPLFQRTFLGGVPPEKAIANTWQTIISSPMLLQHLRRQDISIDKLIKISTANEIMRTAEIRIRDIMGVLPSETKPDRLYPVNANPIIVSERAANMLRGADISLWNVQNDVPYYYDLNSNEDTIQAMLQMTHGHDVIPGPNNVNAVLLVSRNGWVAEGMFNHATKSLIVGIPQRNTPSDADAVIESAVTFAHEVRHAQQGPVFGLVRELDAMSYEQNFLGNVIHSLQRDIFIYSNLSMTNPAYAAATKAYAATDEIIQNNYVKKLRAKHFFDSFVDHNLSRLQDENMHTRYAHRTHNI